MLPSSGAVLPVIISMLESTPDEVTSAPRLSVGIDVLQCNEHVVFFGGQGLKVLSASSRSLQLLGVENDQLQREAQPITLMFPTLDDQRVEQGEWDMELMESMLEPGAGGGGGLEGSDKEARWLLNELRRMRGVVVEEYPIQREEGEDEDSGEGERKGESEGKGESEDSAALVEGGSIGSQHVMPAANSQSGPRHLGRLARDSSFQIKKPMARDGSSRSLLSPRREGVRRSIRWTAEEEKPMPRLP